MKTILYSSCYLEGKDGQGNDRLERTARYIRYYLSQKETLGFESITLFDNGSNQDLYKILGDKVKSQFNMVFGPNLPHGREGKPYDYGNCWRSLYYFQELIKQGYTKIITIDTDTFVLTKNCANYIRDLNSGWTTFWCRKWGFPAAEISILCEDKFDRFLEFCKIPWEQRLGSLYERTLPYTQINIEYYCDRGGEIGDTNIKKYDIYSQLGPELNPQLHG